MRLDLKILNTRHLVKSGNRTVNKMQAPAHSCLYSFQGSDGNRLFKGSWNKCAMTVTHTGEPGGIRGMIQRR